MLNIFDAGKNSYVFKRHINYNNLLRLLLDGTLQVENEWSVNNDTDSEELEPNDGTKFESEDLKSQYFEYFSFICFVFSQAPHFSKDS